MSKRRKLLEKALMNTKNVSFHEFQVLLKHFGFEQIKSNAGSHQKWRHEGKMITFMAPRRNPVKAIYIKSLVSLLQMHFNIKNT